MTNKKQTLIEKLITTNKDDDFNFFLKEDSIYYLIDFETTGIDYKKDIPIEIGYIVFDNKLDIIKKYESLIYIPRKTEILYDTGEYAKEIHGIHLKFDILNKRTKYDIYGVVNDFINDLINIKSMYKKEKNILVSDCIVFEWNFVQKLFDLCYQAYPKFNKRNIEDYFHYVGLDLNILEEIGLIEDISDKKPHRAMLDAELEFNNLRNSIDKIKMLRG